MYEFESHAQLRLVLLTLFQHSRRFESGARPRPVAPCMSMIGCDCFRFTSKWVSIEWKFIFVVVAIILRPSKKRKRPTTPSPPRADALQLFMWYKDELFDQLKPRQKD